MQVFNLFFKLVKANRKMIMIYLATFLGMIIILSKAMYSSDGSKEGFIGDRLEIGIIDEDHSVYSSAIREYFREEHNLKDVENNQEKLLDELYWKSLDYVLVIPKGFSESLENPEIEDMELSSMKVPGYFDAEFFESELAMYHDKLIALLESGYTMEEATVQLKEYQAEKTEVELASFVNQNQNDIVMGIFRYFPYLFASVGIISIGLVMLKINEKEVKDRIECSSAPLKNRTTGLLLGVLAFGAILFVISIVLAIILSEGAVLSDSRTPFFLLNLICILIVNLCLAFFAGTVSKNVEALNGMVNVIGLALCFLGGVFVPQEYMSEGILRVAKFIPTYWYIKNNELIGTMAHVSSKAVQTLVTQCGIMILFGAVVFVLNLVIMNAKRKTQS